MERLQLKGIYPIMDYVFHKLFKVLKTFLYFKFFASNAYVLRYMKYILKPIVSIAYIIHSLWAVVFSLPWPSQSNHLIFHHFGISHNKNLPHQIYKCVNQSQMFHGKNNIASLPCRHYQTKVFVLGEDTGNNLCH